MIFVISKPEVLKTLLDPTLLDPTMAHRILGSIVAHAAMGSRPVATPAAETMSPETVPIYLLNCSWWVILSHLWSLVRWSLELTFNIKGCR